MTTTNIFYRYQLEAFLGDLIKDFDIEAIIDEITEISFTGANRFWKDGIDKDALCSICVAHAL